VSDDGRFTIVVIVLLGNPFSPRYARARASGRAVALDHSALHVAIGGPDARRWALSERRIVEQDRRASEVVLSRSRACWTERGLEVEIHESTTPGRRPIRGRMTLFPERTTSEVVSLDSAGVHRWWPVAPVAHVEVALTEPALRFRGHGYHDANAGATPLESEFSHWAWSRARLTGERSVVTYDVVDRTGEKRARTFLFGAAGFDCAASVQRGRLPTTRWLLDRSIGADRGASPRLVRSLEDGPCYARALAETRLFGEPTVAMHEVLSGDRLRRAWVRFFLGFRIAGAP
jgi:carotenoid 1,2-hydratase